MIMETDTRMIMEIDPSKKQNGSRFRMETEYKMLHTCLQSVLWARVSVPRAQGLGLAQGQENVGKDRFLV